MLGEVRPDKWGGLDGSKYFRRLVCESAPYLLHDTVLVVNHIELAHPTRVQRCLKRVGGKAYSLSIAGSQERTFDRATLDDMLPGLFDYQLNNRKTGKAVFHAGQNQGVMVVALERASCV